MPGYAERSDYFGIVDECRVRYKYLIVDHLFIAVVLLEQAEEFHDIGVLGYKDE